MSSQEYVNWSLELKDSQDDIAWNHSPTYIPPRLDLQLLEFLPSWRTSKPNDSRDCVLPEAQELLTTSLCSNLAGVAGRSCTASLGSGSRCIEELGGDG